jgi:enterochelin esterase family protein
MCQSLKLDRILSALVVAMAAFFLSHVSLQAQRFGRGPRVVSPEVNESKVTFRLHAPSADAVRLSGSEMRGMGFGGAEMTKNEEGIWEITLDLSPGYYRYNFSVDGVTIVDPGNAATSESNLRTWSMVGVPGEDWMDIQRIPHGIIGEVTYWSSILNKFRRLHVYTPPGYETSTDKYPILYLLHGALDSDDSWSTVGRSGIILDNLIAAGQAKPMIVVMPNGHTGPFSFGGGQAMFGEFEEEFVTDIMPFVEDRFRVHGDRANRAMAGLSMGGAHTLFIGIPNLEKFAYLGVWSSGIFGILNGGPTTGPGRDFEDQNKAILDDDAQKDGLKLFSFMIGEEDVLLETARTSVEMFKTHGFDVHLTETDGNHTWENWRKYLYEFAPKLFQ